MNEDSKRSISDDRRSSSDGKKVAIKSADMKEDLQKEAVEITIAAFEKNKVEKDVAEHIKKVFDKKYGLLGIALLARTLVTHFFFDLLSAGKQKTILVNMFK